MKALVTTAYFTAKSKKGNGKNSDIHYTRKMGLVMRLNADMVIYGDNRSLGMMTQARGQQKPLVGSIPTDVNMLPPCSYLGDIFNNSAHYTDPSNVPSVQLGCIWSGKLTEMVRSMKDHPDYPWYIWMDVGFHDPVARERLQQHGDGQWPNPQKLEQLPKGKMIVSHSDGDCDRCAGWEYCHCVSGMTYVVPATLLQRMQNLFSEYQLRCIDSLKLASSAFQCMSDQIILTRIATDYPHLFHFVTGTDTRTATDGYGPYGAVASTVSKTEERIKGRESDLLDFLSN